MSRMDHLVLLATAGLFAAGLSQAATITVDDDGVQCPTRNHTSIQAAVTAAVNGDTIDVCPGTYTAFSTQGKNGLTIRSTAGAATTLVRGYANGCYGIYIPSGTGITIDGFDISPNVVTSGSSCDWAAIATSSNVFDLAIRNNVVHDILAPGSRSCGTGSGSYGIIGFGLNDVHRAVIENNRFYNMNNPGCTPVSPYVGASGTIKSFASAVQVIFASGSNSNPSPGGDLITIRNNSIESANGFSPTSIRVKRSTNFAVTDNTISGMVGTDGTPSFPSTTRGLNPQGSPTTASVQGLLTDNVVTADYGVVLEDYHGTSITGNDLSGVGTTHVYFVRANNNFACSNTLNPTANFNVVSPAAGNTFPGGASFPGNSSCPAPTITCPATLTVQCDESVPPPDPGSVTATDNCVGGAASVVFVSDTPSGSCPKTITRRYRATDSCGVSADCTQTILVNDTTAPVVTQGSIASCYPTQAAAEAAAIAATTATDNCLGPLVKTAATSGDCSATITVTVRDACNNSAQATYNTRIDGTAPTVTAGSIATCYPSVAAAEAAALAATTATDNCPGTVTKTASTTGTCSATVTVTASDSCGNSANVTYSTRIDGTAPTVAAGSIASCYPSVATAEAAALAATTATDNCTGTVTKTASTTGTCSATVTVTASDSCGNSANVTYATRIDGTPPSITPPAPVTVECDDDVPPPNPGLVSATDNCDPPVVTFVGDVTSGTSCSMTVTRTYRATDACGNSADAVQVITVRDTTGPTVAASNDDLYCLSPPNSRYRCFTQADFPGVTASLSDNCDNAPLSWVFSSCVSDQADPTGDDCVIAPDGRSFAARGERETRGHENGRRYRLTVIAEDGCGNHGPPTVIGYIRVPKHAKRSDGCLPPNCDR